MRLMRIASRLALGLLLLFLTGLNAAASGATAEAPPAIVIAEPLYAFPNVVDGTEIHHDFKVQNNGTGELRIEKVETG